MNIRQMQATRSGFAGASALSRIDGAPNRSITRQVLLRHQLFGSPAEQLKIRPRCYASVTPRAAVALFGSAKLPGFGGGDVLVAGATSPLALQITQQLLEAGVSVSAGVTDVDEAQEFVDFAKAFEVLNSKAAQKLRLVELDIADEEALTASLRGKGTVVLLPGDTPNGLDSRAPARILSAAQEAGARKIILVQQKGGGGGGLFGLFGGSSNLEQEVVDSGLQFAIVRTGKQARDVDPKELGSISLGPQGSLPGGGSIAKRQVAEVVAAVLKNASQDVLIEAWADPRGAAVPLDELLSQVLPLAVVETEGESEPEPLPAPEPVKAPARAGRRAAQAAAQALPDEEEAPAPARSLFGFGKKAVQEVEAEVEEAPAQARSLLGFGRQAVQEVQEAQEASGGFFGLGRGRAQPQAPAQPSGGLFGRRQEPQEEQKPSGGLFGIGRKQQAQQEEQPKPAGGLFGGRGRQQQAAQEEAKPSGGLFGLGGRKQADASGENGKPAKGGLFGARRGNQGAETVSPSAGRARKSAAQKTSRAAQQSRPPRPGRQQAEPGPETKTGGFLSALGFGSANEYIDEE